MGRGKILHYYKYTSWSIYSFLPYLAAELLQASLCDCSLLKNGAQSYIYTKEMSFKNINNYFFKIYLPLPFELLIYMGDMDIFFSKLTNYSS